MLDVFHRLNEKMIGIEKYSVQRYVLVINKLQIYFKSFSKFTVSLRSSVSFKLMSSKRTATVLYLEGG